MNQRFIVRRRLLQGAAGTAVAPLLPRVAWSDASEPASPLDAWAHAFADFRESYGPATVSFDRPLPAELEGTLYRNGPARMRRGATRYRHWFDGDGMVHAFALGGQSLQHRARMVMTDKYLADEKAGRFVRPGFGSRIADSLPIGKPDAINVANINVLPLGDELLALWEAGSPWRIDPQSLQTLGRKVWSPETDGLAFSAHPKVDTDGTVWSFGYLPGSGKLVLYRLDARGNLRDTRLIDAPNADMVHDFAITRRYLAFVLMPLVFDVNTPRGNDSFLDRLHWKPERAGTVLLIDKNTLEVAHRMEMPPVAFFHIGNAWEDGDAVRIQLMQIDDFARLMHNLEDALQGKPMNPPAHTSPAEIFADLRKRRLEVRSLSQATAEFPRIDPRHVGRRTQAMFVASRSDAMPEGLFGMNVVARMDTDNGRMQRFDYGAETLVEEHVFVPRPGAPESSGWLVGTAWNRLERQTTLAVFDAAAVDAGPIASARLPYGLPLGLHGNFVAR
jgi:carotenoid cleavage dioxygenase-like enzyme